MAVKQSERFDNLDRQTQRIIVALLEQRNTANRDISLELRDQTLAVIQIIGRMEARILDQLRMNGLTINTTNTVDVSPEAEDGLRAAVEREILQSLSFTTMTDRRDEVAVAHKKTFEWIFENSPTEQSIWSNFSEWLASGDGVYWVKGKAGSGKSTLMRFIELDNRTELYLKKWAGNMPLCSASFFFWNSGTPEQKSQTGLLRSLLYEVLAKQPAMIPTILPWFWAQTYSKSAAMQVSSANFHWSLPRLMEAFKLLVQQPNLPFKMCLFIDGIDEFDGDHEEISELFKTATSDNIKVCLSSRPWHVFEVSFADCASLSLQELTRNDIQSYVYDNLNQNEAYKILAEMEPQAAPALVSEITEKADGVFLWVEIVVKSLLKGLKNHDSISHLRRRLEDLPNRLKDLYRFMFDRIEDLYFRKSAETFQVVRAARVYREHFHSEKPQDEALSIIALFFAVNSDIDVETIKAYQPSDIKVRCKQMKVHVNVHCAGLLEVWKHKSTKIMRVHYLHRTAREFIESPEIWQAIQSQTSGTEFNANTSMLRSCLCQLALLNNSSDRLKVIDLATSAIIFAYHANREEDKLYVGLVDQLDQILSKLLQSKKSEVHWTNEIAETGKKIPSLLAFAVQSDLSFYVKHHVGVHGSLDLSRKLTILLQDVVAAKSITQRLPFSPYTAKLLLDLGADPNQKYEGYSVWEKSLYVLYKHWNSSVILARDGKGRTAQEADNAFALFGAFLEHRANPRAYIIVGNYEKISLSALEVVAKTIERDFPTGAAELKKTLKKHGAKEHTPRVQIPLAPWKKAMHLFWLDP